MGMGLCRSRKSLEFMVEVCVRVLERDGDCLGEGYLCFYDIYRPRRQSMNMVWAGR